MRAFHLASGLVVALTFAASSARATLTHGPSSFTVQGRALSFPEIPRGVTIDQIAAGLFTPGAPHPMPGKLIHCEAQFWGSWEESEAVDEGWVDDQSQWHPVDLNGDGIYGGTAIKVTHHCQAIPASASATTNAAGEYGPLTFSYTPSQTLDPSGFPLYTDSQGCTSGVCYTDGAGTENCGQLFVPGDLPPAWSNTVPLAEASCYAPYAAGEVSSAHANVSCWGSTCNTQLVANFMNIADFVSPDGRAWARRLGPEGRYPVFYREGYDPRDKLKTSTYMGAFLTSPLGADIPPIPFGLELPHHFNVGEGPARWFFSWFTGVQYGMGGVCSDSGLAAACASAGGSWQQSYSGPNPQYAYLSVPYCDCPIGGSPAPNPNGNGNTLGAYLLRNDYTIYLIMTGAYGGDSTAGTAASSYADGLYYEQTATIFDILADLKTHVHGVRAIDGGYSSGSSSVRASLRAACAGEWQNAPRPIHPSECDTIAGYYAGDGPLEGANISEALQILATDPAIVDPLLDVGVDLQEKVANLNKDGAFEMLRRHLPAGAACNTRCLLKNGDELESMGCDSGINSSTYQDAVTAGADTIAPLTAFDNGCSFTTAYHAAWRQFVDGPSQDFARYPSGDLIPSFAWAQGGAPGVQRPGMGLGSRVVWGRSNGDHGVALNNWPVSMMAYPEFFGLHLMVDVNKDCNGNGNFSNLYHWESDVRLRASADNHELENGSTYGQLRTDLHIDLSKHEIKNNANNGFWSFVCNLGGNIDIEITTGANGDIATGYQPTYQTSASALAWTSGGPSHWTDYWFNSNNRDHMDPFTVATDKGLLGFIHEVAKGYRYTIGGPVCDSVHGTGKTKPCRAPTAEIAFDGIDQDGNEIIDDACCPAGWVLDAANHCRAPVAIPAGEQGFVWDENGFHNLYYAGPCDAAQPVPGQWFDGQNCWIGQVPLSWNAWADQTYTGYYASPKVCSRINVPSDSQDPVARVLAQGDCSPDASAARAAAQDQQRADLVATEQRLAESSDAIRAIVELEQPSDAERSLTACQSKGCDEDTLRALEEQVAKEREVTSSQLAELERDPQVALWRAARAGIAALDDQAASWDGTCALATACADDGRLLLEQRELVQASGAKLADEQDALASCQSRGEVFASDAKR